MSAKKQIEKEDTKLHMEKEREALTHHDDFTIKMSM